MSYHKHPNAIVESEKIGEGTNIWAFAHILPNATIGKHCNICDGVFVEGKVQIGNSVTVKCGVQLWDGIRIEDKVFIGPNATFANDSFPRSKNYLSQYPNTILREGCSIGANATILAGLTIGKNAMVGAGSVVTKDVPPNAIVIGNPAQIVGYVSTTNVEKIIRKWPLDEHGNINQSSANNVKIVKLPMIPDLRGSLSFAEVGKHLPFVPKRYFLVYDVPNKEVRGEHAHKKLEQFLVCVKGSCSVVVDDSITREEYVLDRPDIGIYLPNMTWGVQYKYSSDAILLVLASESYSADDYIRDYDDFIKLKSEQ